jgi:trans-AT polyketide synthase/acyltransferase/oxidoreductase domain-containing protein
METLIEKLSGYGAQEIRIENGDEVLRSQGVGGRLEESFGHLGSGPLVGVLVARPALKAIVLEDAGVTLRVARLGNKAVLQVRWATGERHEESLELLADNTLLHDGTCPLFRPDPSSAILDPKSAIQDPTQAVFVVQTAVGQEFFGKGKFGSGSPLTGSLAPSEPLGPAWFRDRLGTRANYIAGAMAGGIASPALVIAMGQGGYIGFYGSGGLPIEAVEAGIKEIKAALGDSVPAGFNLLHNPVEPQVEESTVDLFLKYRCQMVSASAFMGLTPAVVRYRYTGIHRTESGAVDCPNRLYAKVSRPEVAKHFLAPAPEKLLQELVASGRLTVQEAELAKAFPMADGITCEADSGGHTDGRPLSVILPVIKALRDRLARSNSVSGVRVAIGAAGGLGCPASIAAAFEMGADYVLTGSVNQCSPEAGTSDLAKSMLLQAGLADVDSGAAPDMFEMGAHVQVLSRGSMYAKRSGRLFDLYKRYGAWEQIPEKDQQRVEKQMLCRPFSEVWADTESYWAVRDPKQVERAMTDGRHKMALVFRWYLGMSSRWARMGDASRKKDFQIWCGAAMGAFNDWVAGTSMEPLASRGVVEMADALLKGASVVHRARRLASQGVDLPEGTDSWQPV